MNEQHNKQQQAQRDRTNTVYYDAQTNFGTPPNDVAGSGDYKDYKMGIRKASGSSDRGVADDVLYERVHTERRHHHSTSSSSPYPHRPPSREYHHPSQQQQHSHQPTVIHHQIRSPSSSSSGGPVIMAPMSTSYDYSIGSSAFRKGAEPMDRWAGPREEFRPGPRATSAANIDALFAPRSGRMTAGAGYSDSASSPLQTTNVMYSRRNPSDQNRSSPIRSHHIHTPSREPPKDYGVVGAYSQQQNQQQAPQRATSRGSVRQHSNDYELDPRLNVTYPQFYVDDWKERHSSGNMTPTGYPRGGNVPRHSPSFTSSATVHPQMGTSSGRPRFASDAAIVNNSNRHLYEEVPMGGANGYRSPAYGMRETAILDDYDNVPSEYLDEGLRKNTTSNTTKEDMASNKDGESGIYQPGRYQPC